MKEKNKLVVNCTKKQTVEHHRVLAHINFESFAGPPTHGLYQDRRDSMFGKGRSTASPHELPGDTVIKEKM